MTIEKSPAQPGRYSYVCLLRLPEVMNRVGLGKTQIYRGIATGDFPAQVRLSERASAWPENEISAWIDARIAERDASGRAA